MRRSVLLPSARIFAVLLLGLAAGGCDGGIEGFVDMILSGTGFETVNVVNGTDRPISGTITVTDPTGRQVLSDAFRLEPEEDGGFQVNLTVDGVSSIATYGATFRETGRYSVSLELDEPIGGTRAVEKAVEISDPEEQRLLVVLDPEDEAAVQVVRLPNPEKEE